ncbi:putative surface protein with fasciclin (FAS1) repeats [Deinobacterium chartae]|uniref:Putative surface protein with fasciclin (FAS1) repeats n=1 Tax=Deinobacterium chartae TaxID=521158 RepID=A0A841I6V9_9DEIO|nr:fasciclin domain-containing protein [Deinobacterium chartae]MBB6099969.1 putative surface protein with fasciclin (FAS1) repeats [Deinobacterium chartae]
MNKMLFNIAVTALLGLGAAHAQTTPPAQPTAPAAPAAPATNRPATIVELINTDARLTTLKRAIEAAGLTQTLTGEGPYTLFAPTNDAFAKIPQADLDALLNDPERLTALLQYHMVSGNVAAAQLETMTSLPAMGGGSLTLSREGTAQRIGTAGVVVADIPTNNGTVHLIDTVLMPPSM